MGAPVPRGRALGRAATAGAALRVDVGVPGGCDWRLATRWGGGSPLGSRLLASSSQNGLFYRSVRISMRPFSFKDNE